MCRLHSKVDKARVWQAEGAYYVWHGCGLIKVVIVLIIILISFKVPKLICRHPLPSAVTRACGGWQQQCIFRFPSNARL